MKFALCEYVKDGEVFRWETFNSPLLDAETWRELLASPELEIDLENTGFLTHDGMMWVAFICLRRALEDAYTYIHLPSNPDRIGYLKYIGFHYLQVPLRFSFTNEFLLRQAEDKYKVSATSRFSPHMLQLVTASRWPHVANQAFEHIGKFFTQELGIRPEYEEYYEGLRPFAGTLQELIHNIALHGGNEEGGGVGIIAYTPPPKAHPRIRFCCNDIGGGFRSTLNRKFANQLSTDRDAIVEALLLRYFKREEGIVGLYPTLRYIRVRNGCIGIRTGDVYAKLDFLSEKTRSAFDELYDTPTKDWLRGLLKFTKCVPIPGTHIFVDLQLPDRMRRTHGYR